MKKGIGCPLYFKKLLKVNHHKKSFIYQAEFKPNFMVHFVVEKYAVFEKKKIMKFINDIFNNMRR